MPKRTPEQIAVHLKYHAHRRADIADTDRGPESLILAALADGPAHLDELERFPWWGIRGAGQPRDGKRFHCALDRLSLEGEVVGCSSGWQLAPRPEEVSPSDAREQKQPERSASSKKQMSLF